MLKMYWSHGHNQSIHNGIPRFGYQKGGKSAMWVDEDMADYFTDIAKKFLTEHKEKPFVLYFGLHQPQFSKNTGNELGNIPEGGLFDLKADLGQRHNLADKEVEKFNEIKSRFLIVTDGFYDENK